MNIRIESSSEKLIRDQYSEIFEYMSKSEINFSFKRDQISFGNTQNLVLVGLVFIYDNLISGITYDILKAQIVNLLKSVPKDKRKNISVSVRDKKKGKEYDLSIDYDSEEIEIEIPKQLKIKITK